MSSDTPVAVAVAVSGAGANPPTTTVEHENGNEPITPQDHEHNHKDAPHPGPAASASAPLSASASQQSLPSTEPPASPNVPALPAMTSTSSKPDRNDDRPASANSAAVIPSSLTPPPSSQVPSNNNASRAAATSKRQRMLSPPVTGLNPVRPDATPAGLYAAPRPEQVVAAAPDELRAMLQSCIAEQSRLKMEAAHHKLQYQLLSVRADEDAHRAQVEQEMTLRQLDALRRQKPDPAPRPLKRNRSPDPDITHAMYDELRVLGDKALKDNEKLRRDYDEANKRLKAAKKLIVRQEEDTDRLREDNDLLRNRLLDKRALWKKLDSPGGMFHTPKTAHASLSPAQYRQTPRQTPKQGTGRTDRGRDLEAQPFDKPFDVLLQAANQENSSAPSTPMTPNRSSGAARHPLKHSRGVQSLSSLPSTPNNYRPRGSDLLPPPDLVPHTEPTRRFVNRSFVPDTPDRTLNFPRDDRDRQGHGRHSRESTISADDNQELARAALQSVAQAQQATTFGSRGSPPPRVPRVPLPSHRSSQRDEEDSQVYESQASQEALAMLRRDPRESFEVASSQGNSRDVTPTPEKRLQSTLRGPIHKPGSTTGPVKRKLEATTEYRPDARREPNSPTKRLRLAGGLREGNPILGLPGLGIRDAVRDRRGSP